MDLCNRNDIQALLLRHGFRFSKSMGQNFLIADWVPRNTAEASGADKNSGVLEVGPGIGPLTRELCQRAGKVVSVELDHRLYPVLAETLSEYDNFTLVEGDILKQDLSALVAEHFAGLRPILCANLPYNITTPLLTACVKAKCFTSITVLIQKEVAQRICAQPEPEKKDAPAEKPVRAGELNDLERMAREIFGTRAKIEGDEDKGRLILNYYSQDDLQRIWEILEFMRQGGA